MSARKTKPAEWVDLLISKAEAMRKAGVSSFRISPDGTAEVQMHPYVEGLKRERHLVEEPPDVMEDPETFGLRSGFPGFSALHEPKE